MATKIKVIDEAHFQVNAPNFAISPSATGYILHYSADGIHFTAWTDGTLAGVTQVVSCGAAGMYYYLDGNVGEVIVTY